MKPLKAVAAIVKDEPLGIDERIEHLEQETTRKLEQFEEALGIFKDLVIKLYEEKEQLKLENASLRDSISQKASGIKDAIVKPIMNAGEDFVELFTENEEEQPAQKIIGNTEQNMGSMNNIALNRNTDEMTRTISWMREKFGLPAKVRISEIKQVKARKKRR